MFASTHRATTLTGAAFQIASVLAAADEIHYGESEVNRRSESRSCESRPVFGAALSRGQRRQAAAGSAAVPRGPIHGPARWESLTIIDRWRPGGDSLGKSEKEPEAPSF